MTTHHRFLLRLHLRQIDAIDEAVTAIEQEVNAHLEPFRTAISQLKTTPGIKDIAACVILA